MRIINMIPSYQVLTFISICVPNSYVYLQGFTEVFQGIALYAFLMLLCDFLAPTDQDKIKCFSSLEIKRQWQPKMKRNGLAFLKVSVPTLGFLTTGYLTTFSHLVDLVVCVAISHHHLDCSCCTGGDPVIA